MQILSSYTYKSVHSGLQFLHCLLKVLGVDTIDFLRLWYFSISDMLH